MHPYSVKFGGGTDATVLHPAVLVALLLALVLIFVLPRRYAVAPLLLTIFLVPQGQQFYVAGVHLFVSRLLILGAFLRAVSAKEPNQKTLFAGGWMAIDTAVVFYMAIVATATMLQYPGMASLINQIGYLWDCMLGYLTLRSLIRDERGAILAIQCTAVLAIIFAVGMVIEQMKMVNVFGLLGGVASVPELREGKIRSQAAFQHALTAGTFGGTAIPLFAVLWMRGKTRWLSALGLVGATVMVVTTQTSTSLLTAAAGALAIFFWPLRKKMKMVRMGVVALLIALAMVMKAPVWFVIAHIDLTGSSSNYQRAELIDQCVNHFSQWWLMGAKDVASWGFDMWDAQNMFVSVAEAGGLVALIFFILAISRGFARIGNARRRAQSRKQEWLFWLLGAAFFAHLTAFFGVNYFDQCRMTWFALISMICACTLPALSRNAVAVPSKVVMHVNLGTDARTGKEIREPEPAAHNAGHRFYLD